MSKNSMLSSCFAVTPNSRPRQPSARLITVAPTGTGFESRAFAALFKHSSQLGIKNLWRCNAARMDGYLETTRGEIILVEMKESLRWGSTQSAGFQFLAGRNLLGLKKAKRGIIVFERWSSEWGRTKPNGAWGQLAMHSQEFANLIEIGALQVLRNGSLKSATHRVP